MRIEYNRNIADFTTFGIDAKAAAVAFYSTADDLVDILSNKSLPRPIKPIGQGSNLLFVSDFPGTLLVCEAVDVRYAHRPDSSVELRAAAGVTTDSICALMAQEGIWGIENLSGIPGTAGASAVQNVGAYGLEAAEITKSVEVIDTLTLERKSLSPVDMRWSYRDSALKHTDRYIVTEVVYVLPNQGPIFGYANMRAVAEGIADGRSMSPAIVREAVLKLRSEKLPAIEEYGSAGSFFKNPVVSRSEYDALKARFPEIPGHPTADGCVKLSAAWLIDHAGFKGWIYGGAGVWPTQPLVIYNAGDATAADVIHIENTVRDGVMQKYGVALSPEVEHIGALQA